MRIICTNCGKNYNFKNKQQIYVCQGRNNRGKKFCDSKIIKRKDLDYIVTGHYKIYGESNVEKVMVDVDGSLVIYYEDGGKSVWDDTKLVF